MLADESGHDLSLSVAVTAARGDPSLCAGLAAIRHPAWLWLTWLRDNQGLFRCFGALGLLWLRAGVLWRSRGGKDAMAQQFVAGTAEHLPLARFVLWPFPSLRIQPTSLLVMRVFLAKDATNMRTPRPSLLDLDLAQLTQDLLPSQATTFRRLLEAQADTPNREDQAYILLRRAGLSDADAIRAIRNARRPGSS